MTVKREGQATLAALLEGNSREEVAIHHGGDAVTYGSLEGSSRDASERARAVMAPGSAVCLAAAAGPDFVAGLFGLARAGMQIGLVHHALSFGELDRILCCERADAVISGNSHWGGERPAMSSGPFIGGLWLHVLEPLNDAGEIGSGGKGIHIYTSGTDGRPKGVIRSDASLVAEARAISAHLSYGRGERILCATPLCHVYGLVMGLLGAFARAASAIIANPGTPNLFRRCLDRFAPNVLIAVPTQYDLWSQSVAGEPGRAPMRLCISSGAPLSPTIARSFYEKWGRWPVEQYGMSETGAVAIDLDAAPGSRTVGKAYPGVEVVIDAADGASGGEGEVIVRSPFLASGYVGHLERSLPRNPFSARGFLTGEVGRIDEDGRLVLTRPRGGQINVHGNKVDPAEVEAVIARYAGVREVVVLGVGTANEDQWVAAFVAADATMGCDELLSFCQRDLAPYKCPRRVIRVESIPRNAMGKVMAHELIAAMRR